MTGRKRVNCVWNARLSIYNYIKQQNIQISPIICTAPSNWEQQYQKNFTLYFTEFLSKKISSISFSSLIKIFSALKNTNYIGVAPFTHVRNKNSHIQRRSPNVVKVIFHTIRNCS